MKTMLIIGGTGFIGRNLAKRAINLGNKVIVLSVNKCLIEKQIPGVRYIHADLNDKFELLKVLVPFRSDINYVVNTSGYVNHSNFFNGGDSVIQTHLNGLFNLVRCLDMFRIKGFVQVGSGDEYGLLKAPQSEDQREQPASCYSFAKTAANHFIQMMYRENNIPMVGIRVFLTYGPGQDDNRFIPQIIKGCMSGTPFNTSEGKQVRDFCYIDDIVDGIFCALTNRAAYGKVINLASGYPMTIKDAILLIKETCGCGYPVFGKMGYRKNENMAWYDSGVKAKRILGWQAKTPFMLGLKHTFEDYKERING